MSLLSLLSDLVVLIHLTYATFVLVGFLAILIGARFGWRWIRNRPFRLTHLACIILVAGEAVAGQICPLTLLENWLLITSGKSGYDRSFIGQLLYNLLYYDFPTWVFTAVYLLLAALTAVTLLLIPPRRRPATPAE